MLGNLLYIILAILILSVIVVFHEFGHYIVGRLTGIGVLEFAVGMGPKLFGWTRNGIDYSLRAIPLGGYCKFKGEGEEVDEPDSYSNAPVWKRFLTVVSGPLMNFVLAFLAVFIVLILNGRYDYAPLVGEVIEGMPAAEAGLQAGDMITAINGEELTIDQAGMLRMQEVVNAAQPGDNIEFTVDRDGEIISLIIAPVFSEDQQKVQIGIYFGYLHHSYTAGELLPASVDYIRQITVTMLDSLRQLFFRGQGLDQTMGPVGIISTVGSSVQQGFQQTTQQGFAVIFYMMLIISLNLGIMNLLPIPPLDGGHLVLMLVEMVRRKPNNQTVTAAVQGIGVLLMLALFVTITYQDIMRVIFG